MTISHSNKVKIKCNAIESIEYIDGSLVITGGQPSSPPPKITESGATWTIDMECGRKGSSSVADKFKDTCGGAKHVYCPTAFSDKTPGKLNFYFGVRVGFSLSGETYFVEIYLGQGHVFLRNNWWIGGKCIANKKAVILNVPTIPTLDLAEVYTISGGISNFELKSWLATEHSHEQPNWLRAVPDSKAICDINLPGTHDSAAINALLSTPYACHSHTLSQQMLYGVRLLDIRLSVHENRGEFTFITCHGDIGPNEYQTFPSALDECRAFLSGNPSEFIAMSLKVDDWNKITNKTGAYTALANLLNGYPVYTSANMPTLGQVRGKIYLLNRMTNDLNLGVPIGWTDNTPGSWAGDKSNRNFRLYVQDKYTGLGSSTESAEEEKFRLFTQAIPVTSRGQMLLNFASGVQSVIYGVYIMGQLLEYFGKNDAGGRPARLGWSLFDYISTAYSTNVYGYINILQIIISSNFDYKGYTKSFKVDTGHEEL